jgi:acetyl-CoA/propionyl-CoA carboxylase biotin carboxyl carrier protein
MFETVLVANRGEIACRVIRTLRALGIRSVAVFSDADADARHVRLADVAVRIGPAPAAQSYLSVEAILRAAVESGADAIHPGYGFLSENPELARACERAGIVFVGPSVDALEIMGDKIRAKERVAQRGVPLIHGVGEQGMTDRQLIDAAGVVGYPLIIKPSAGGGGKGMQVVDRKSDLPEAIASARRVAVNAFGDDTLLLESYVHQPRHIEVQVLSDSFGTIIHLGERECSLQRRHQKIVEEAPSPLLTDEQRHRMGEAACEVARSVAYQGAGTVEFLVSASAPGDFFFMEMNTRLQVEHPVTELVTSLDLVEQQLRIAAGEPLAIAQGDVHVSGHAIEARVYAEDPAEGFLPSTGRIRDLSEPAGTGIRVDSGMFDDQLVGVDYDPMLAKIVARGDSRAEALARLDRALADTRVSGLRTNREFLRSLLAEPVVIDGTMDTLTVDEFVTTWKSAMPPMSVISAAALALAAELVGRPSVSPTWQRSTGWRVGEHNPIHLRLRLPRADDFDVFVGEPGEVTIGGESHHAVLGDRFIEYDGVRTPLSVRVSNMTAFMATPEADFEIDALGREQQIAERRASVGAVAGISSPLVRAPMPGSVVAVHVASGDSVEAGQLLVTIEAMKMEHKMLAPTSGVVTVDVQNGDQVRLDEVVASINPHEGELQ